MSLRTAGAHSRSGRRRSPTAAPADEDRRPGASAAPIGPWAFAGVAVASLGGPLALAALVVPGVAGDAADSGGLVVLAAGVAFGVPLAIWLRYARDVAGAGGLYAFVEAAAGRRVALGQAAIWTFSYVLYVVYTTVQIVYDLLPALIPGERALQTPLALLIPLALAAVMTAGRRVALLVIGAIAAGQLALAGVVDGVTLAHVSAPASALGARAGIRTVAGAGARTSLLYVCGSLPLFLGGEVADAGRTIRRGLLGATAITTLVVVLAVAPLAAAPGLTRTVVPGVAVVAQFAGAGLARAVGIGIALSVAGVMLCEYLALTRLVHAVTGQGTRRAAAAIGAVLLVAAPISLIDPDGFYDTLLRPSLIALWLSQLIVFAVFPSFAARHGRGARPAWALSLGAGAWAVYGLWMTLAHASS